MIKKLPGPAMAWFGLAAALITAWLYRGFIFDPETMLFGQEMIDQSWQLREFALSEIEAGRGLPLWNPYLFGGVPYVAILPGPVFYPTTALYFVMPLFRAIGWTFALHTFLAGLFAWFAARSISLRRWPAAVTGLAFMLTGFFVSMNYAGHDGRMFTIALIPLAFACLERGLQSRRLEWFLAMGLVVACQIFTPHVQLMYYSSLALSLYMLVRVIWMARDEGDWKPAGRVFGFYALGFAAAAAIGMAQLLPTLELREIAVRGTTGLTGYEFAASWAVPGQEVTALVLPDLVGSLDSYWGTNPFKQHTEYLGIVPAVLAIIALTTVRRDRRVGLIAGIAALCVLFALGAATPVHRLAYEIVPMVPEFRAASMMMGPAAFFIALLAGVGWHRVLEARAARGHGNDAGGGAEAGAGLAWGWILGLSAPVLVLGLAAALAPDGLVRWAHTSWYPEGWPKRPSAGAIGILQASGWLLLGIWGSVLALARAVERGRVPTQVVLVVLTLLVLDLGRVDQRYIGVTTPAAHFAPDALQADLRDEMDPLARVFPLDGYGPNAMMVHDIRSVTGMQNFRLEWTEALLGSIEYRNLLRAPTLWPLLDVDYLITRREVQTPLLERGPTGPRGTAWRLTDDQPHAWFPGRVVAQPDPGDAVRRLAGRSSITDFAFVAAGPSEAADGASAADLPEAGRGSARVTSFTPNAMALDVEAEAGGLLVVSEIFHPNWRAFVDGEPVTLWRADLALRGVEVPPGRHEVRFLYSPRSVRRGLIVGGVALALTLATIVFGLVRRKRTG